MVLMDKISQKFYKICFISYSITLSIKNSPQRKKIPNAVKDGAEAGVALTAVKDSTGFFKGFP